MRKNKMKYNAITILVDSAMWECCGTTRAKVSATPFLDSLKKESIVTTKLYSHAPFTDAATKSLYSGRNTLDDYSFFLKLNSSPSNHFKSFHDNGYETYGLYYPYYMYGNEIQKNIDHSFYTGRFTFQSEWHSFMWFADILKVRELDQREMKLCMKRMELMFEVWDFHYNYILKHPESMQLLEEPFNRFDVNKGLSELRNLHSLYNADKEKFIIDFLKTNGDEFRKIDGVEFNDLMNRDFIENEIYKKYDWFFKKASKLNRKANLFKNAPSFKRICYGLKTFAKKRNVNDIKFLANYYYSLRPIKEMKKASRLYEWQTDSSSFMQMDLASRIIRDRKNAEKPFYLSMHVMDPHNYLECFTYDKQDSHLIEDEITMLNDYLDQLGSDFIGNILYFMSMRYVDHYIEKFCNDLKEMGLWDTTALLIVADHGSSYTFYPIHGARVNCFDDECYHIPMYMRVPNLQPIEVSHYCNSKDVLPTYLDVLGLKLSSDFKGHSLLDKNYAWPDYVMTEYTGPGCPEVRGRRLWFSIRNKEYMVAYRVAVYEPFEEGELVEVHDLKKDPNCYYNIADSIDRSKIEYLLVLIQKRFDEVCHDSQLFIDSL